MGTPDAPFEPGRNPGARERLLDQALVAIDRPHEHRHLVEGHAARRRREHTAGDLSTLAPLARCGEALHGVVGRPHRWRRLREEEGLETLEIGHRRRPDGLLDTAPANKRISRGGIVARHGRQRPGRRTGERQEKPFLHRRLDGHVHQHERQSNDGVACHPVDGRLEQSRPIGHGGGVHEPAGPFEQLRHVGAGAIGVSHRFPGDAGLAQVAERARHGARESGGTRDGREIGQRIVPGRLEGGARGDGLEAERRHRSDPAPGQVRDGQARGELCQAEAVDADGGGSCAGDPADEVIGGATRGRHDGDRIGRRSLAQTRGDGLEAGGAGCRDDQADTCRLAASRPFHGAMLACRAAGPW
jgi:hypothetical protein